MKILIQDFLPLTEQAQVIDFGPVATFFCMVKATAARAGPTHLHARSGNSRPGPTVSRGEGTARVKAKGRVRPNSLFLLLFG